MEKQMNVKPEVLDRNKERGCWNCAFRKDCGGYRDKKGRCPEGMVDHIGRWRLLEYELKAIRRR